MTGDTIVAKRENSVSSRGKKYALAMLDIGTDWEEFYPMSNRDTKEAKRTFRHFAGNNVIHEFYSDNAPELSAAAEELDWVHPTSTPFLSKRNGKAERRNELMEDGTATALRTAGFPDNMWDVGGEYQSTARNIQIRNGDSCYNKRHQK